MNIIANIEKHTVDNSKSHKKPVSKIQAPSIARSNKKQTSRTSIKAPTIPTSIKTPTLPSAGEELDVTALTKDNADVGGIQRPEEHKTEDNLKKVKCDNFTCFINTDGQEAHLRHNSKENAVIIDDNADTITIGFNSSDWLFSQTTAVASVDIIEGFKISPTTSQFVNNNGNAFSDRILAKYYKTFIGSHNYRNHNQNPEESYGIIIDAVMRKVPLKNNPEVEVIYIDTLIATNRNKDPQWSKAIENGVVKFVSMGAESSSFRCTYCGNIATSIDEFCDHFKYSKGKYFIDDKGRKLRIAHLVEDYRNKQGQGYVEFIELSYLDVNPAFKGASTSHILDIPADTELKVELPSGYLSKNAFKTWQGKYSISDKKGNDILYEDLFKDN